MATLSCTSHFSDLASGARLPEMDDYAWFDFADVSRHTTRRMAAVLAGRIELDRLLARLAAPAGERARRRDNGGVQAGAADAPAHRLSHARAAHRNSGDAAGGDLRSPDRPARRHPNQRADGNPAHGDVGREFDGRAARTAGDG